MQIQRILKTARRYLADKNYRFLLHASYGLYDHLPDKEYLSRMYKAKTGKELNLADPKTFNEKLQWLKLYNRRPIYSELVDKFTVRTHIAERIGENYCVPLLGVWSHPEEINFNALPNQFVLKCNHNSGLGMCICRDKTKLDIKKARKNLTKGLAQNYFYHCREWPYKNVNPCIIAEKYMQDGEKENLPVYKIFNFAGEPRIIQVIQDDKTPNESIDYFDTEWNLLNLRQNYPNSNIHLPKPALLEEMLHIAKKLSEGFPFVRTDLYTINGNVYFSEYTFFSDAGFESFDPENWDSILGSWITLPEKTCQ